MKKIILIAVLVSGLFGGSVQGGLTDGQVVAVQKLVQMYGYKCDSVNYASRSNWSGAIRFVCNNNRYVYEVKDVGGRWTVTVD